MPGHTAHEHLVFNALKCLGPGIQTLDHMGHRIGIDIARPDALVELYESQVQPMARKTFDAEERRSRDNRYQWPLTAAFLIWIVELCLGERKR